MDEWKNINESTNEYSISSVHPWAQYSCSCMLHVCQQLDIAAHVCYMYVSSRKQVGPSFTGDHVRTVGKLPIVFPLPILNSISINSVFCALHLWGSCWLTLCNVCSLLAVLTCFFHWLWSKVQSKDPTNNFEAIFLSLLRRLEKRTVVVFFVLTANKNLKTDKLDVHVSLLHAGYKKLTYYHVL